MKIPRLLPGGKRHILMVCGANVCRSPMAEALLRHKLELVGLDGRFKVHSAGTRAMVGAPPDPRVVEVLRANGIAPPKGHARQANPRELAKMDLILVMERKHLEQLPPLDARPKGGTPRLITDFSAQLEGQEIPDPYFGNKAGFEHVHELLSTALDAVVERALPPLLEE